MTLKEMREKKGLTQEQASKVLEINQIYLSHLENHKRNPSRKLMKKMSKLYNVDIVDIFLTCDLPK